MAVSDRVQMIAQMRPQRRPGEYVYANVSADDLPGLQPVMTFTEDEGLTVILDRGQAEKAGLGGEITLAWITLQVNSALDGVGLTAAVSTALAGAEISCNVVAALHHDHIFLPVADADRAIDILEELSRSTAALDNRQSLDVLVLGGSGVDTIVPVPVLPLPFADSYLVPGIVTRAGQTGDNVALGLHALGLRTRLIDVLGDDPEGRLVRELHARHGVDFTAIPTPAGTKRAVNLIDPDGARLSLYDGTRSNTEPFPADLITDVAKSSRHVHVSITQPCGEAIPLLTGLGPTVSTDLHDWDGINPYHETFAYQADLVFLSATALPDLTATLQKVLTRGRAQLVVATAGADGAYLLERGAAGVQHVPAIVPTGSVVDTNGAGDAFISGFLFGYLSGHDPATSARMGSIAGAHACTVPSTRVDPISRDQLLRARSPGGG